MSRLKDGAEGPTHFTSRLLPTPLVAFALVVGLVTTLRGLPGSGVRGTLTVSLDGPTTGSINASLSFSANASGGSGSPTPTPTPTPGTPTPTPTPGTPTPTPTPGTPTPTATPTPGGPLAVTLDGPTTGSINTSLSFGANASAGTQPYTYSWACDYNPILPLLSPGPQTKSCSYSVAGVYNVKVHVTDSSGTVTYAESSDYFVTIGGAPTPTPLPSLTVFVTGPSSGARGVPLTFTASASGGSGSYSYAWWCDYSTFVAPVGSAPARTCTYSLAGTYNVKARVIDTVTGASNVSPDYFVTITGLPAPSSGSTLTGPTLTVNQFNGRYGSSSGSPVTFTATETEANASFAWDFGDGSPAGSGRVVTHTYNTSGSYRARLTVTGNDTTTSGTASATINIDVSGPPPPSVAYTVSGATKTGPDAYEVEAGKAVTFAALETRASSYLWDFGDGTAATGKSVTKAWSTVALRAVILAVTGDGTNTSGASSASITVNVIPAMFKAIIVPGAAHLDLGASVWATDVSVTNPGSDTLTITPNFVPYLDGTPDNLDLSQIPYDSRLSFQLAAGASWSQVDVVKFLNGGSNKGTLVFKYEGSGDPVMTARVYFASASDPQGPSYGAAFPSYLITGGGGLSTQGTDEAVTTDQTLIGLRSNNLYRFRVTLFNADSRAGIFRLTAFDQAGNPQFMKDAAGHLVGFRDFKIGPYQQASPSDDDLGLKDASTRYVLKASRAPTTSTGTLIAFGTALDRKTSDLVQIADDTPSTVAESGVIFYYVAGVAHLDTSRAQWRTDLQIYNKSSSPRVLGFEYYFTKGTGSPEQKAQVVNVPIPANGLLAFDDVVDSLMKRDTATDLTGDTAGMLRIFHFEDADSGTNPLVISSRNYDDPSDGSGTAGTQLGVYSSSQTTKPGNPALVMPGAENSERFYAVIGFFAVDAVPTTGRVSAVGEDGKEVGFYDFVLNQPGGIGRFGQIFLTALKDPANPASPATIPSTPITIRVTVTQGGRVGGYVVTVDRETNDLTFIQGRPQS